MWGMVFNMQDMCSCQASTTQITTWFVVLLVGSSQINHGNLFGKQTTSIPRVWQEQSIVCSTVQDRKHSPVLGQAVIKLRHQHYTKYAASWLGSLTWSLKLSIRWEGSGFKANLRCDCLRSWSWHFDNATFAGDHVVRFHTVLACDWVFVQIQPFDWLREVMSCWVLVFQWALMESISWEIEVLICDKTLSIWVLSCC